MSEKPYSEEMLALAEKWTAGTITPEERTRLFEWYDRFDDTQLTLDGSDAALFGRLKQEMLLDIRRKIKPPGKISRLARVSVAAAALLLVTTGGWLALHDRTSARLAVAVPAKKTTPQVSDIAPGTNKAILTLADGSTVTLDSAHTGNLTNQGNAEVIKRGDGQLQYASTNSNTPPASMVYNVLSTPRGGEYRLKLQDGTNVWLNAGSSIRYPTTFIGKERRVEITGEAYFEVAKNADMPFRVSVNDPAAAAGNTEIEVLGTGFDVNAYRDENGLKTTLVEGSVKVTGTTGAVTLKPSQQAISSGNQLRMLQLDNTEQTIAWKNGYFEFENADIPTIMRQISRWYDVDVEYQGKASDDRFSGRFSRSISLATVLQILHTSGVRLLAEDKKIVIRS